MGWQNKTYLHNYIYIEGVAFIDDEATTPYLLRTHELTLSDNKLTMAMGIFNKYTMLNYLDIEAVILAPIPEAERTSLPWLFLLLLNNDEQVHQKTD